MEKGNRIFGGLCLIAIAILVMLNQMDLLGIGMGLGKLIIIIIAVAMLVNGVAHKSFFGVFCPVGLLYLLFQDDLGFPTLSLWTVALLVALFSIGFRAIFPKKMRDVERIDYGKSQINPPKQSVTDTDNDGYVICSNKFGSLAKYVNTRDFKGANISNAFGELKVYFDQAVIINSPVTISVDNSFGATTIYVPRSWNIKTNFNVFAADCKVEQPTRNDGPEVYIGGNVNFGEVKVFYI